MSKQKIDRINTQARDARQARERQAAEEQRQRELSAAQDAAATKIAGLLKALGEYQDRFTRDLHPTWPQIGSANAVIKNLEEAAHHACVKQITEEVRS